MWPCLIQDKRVKVAFGNSINQLNLEEMFTIKPVHQDLLFDYDIIHSPQYEYKRLPFIKYYIDFLIK